MILRFKDGTELKIKNIAEHYGEDSKHLEFLLDPDLFENAMDLVKSVVTPENITRLECVNQNETRLYEGYSYIKRISEWNNEFDEVDDLLYVLIFDKEPKEYEKI